MLTEDRTEHSDLRSVGTSSGAADSFAKVIEDTARRVRIAHAEQRCTPGGYQEACAMLDKARMHLSNGASIHAAARCIRLARQYAGLQSNF